MSVTTNKRLVNKSAQYIGIQCMHAYVDKIASGAGGQARQH